MRKLLPYRTATSLALVAGLAGVAHAQDVLSVSSGDRLQMTTEAPDYYTVQPGDTLWEISSKFLGNAYYWPRLWSINDYITNPHWIYPGNRIVFRMGTLVEPPSVELDSGQNQGGYVVEGLEYETTDAECGPDVAFDNTHAPRSYVAPGFLADKDDVEIYGEVYKAKGGQTFLSEGDTIYLNLDDPDAFDCGDVVSVFRRVKKKVRHPNSRRTKYGSMYKVVAEAKVVHRYEDTVTAVIRQSWQELQRGDLVGPATPVAVEVEVGPPRGDLEATVVSRINVEDFMMGPGETIFLDRGRADGVRVGNTFYITAQQDEYSDRGKPDTSLPPHVIGRVVVVRVDEYSSTAVVTDATRSLEVGAALTQQVQ